MPLERDALQRRRTKLWPGLRGRSGFKELAGELQDVALIESAVLINIDIPSRQRQSRERLLELVNDNRVMQLVLIPSDLVRSGGDRCQRTSNFQAHWQVVLVLKRRVVVRQHKGGLRQASSLRGGHDIVASRLSFLPDG